MTPHNPRPHRPDRRHFLQTALTGVAGTVLAGSAGTIPQAALAAEETKKANACIVLWMSGGPSQLDTFDLKPDAPAEIRGEYKPIETRARGVRICEHLPKLAKQADKLAIIRSMQTADADHNRGTIHMLTGFPADPLGFAYPWIGSVVARYKADPKSGLPGCVSLARLVLGNHPDEAFLGPAYQPLRLDSLADAPEGKIRTVCDIGKEWDKLGKVYGESELGKNCLAARRLVEAGVPFVQVTHHGYDHHANLFAGLKGRLAELDPAWSGLLQDLADRGLLDTTLVVWMGEFGRTPRINANGGRDHWTKGWSVVLAGGGIKRGLTYGATAKDGSGVDDKPVTEGALLATVYTALGINPRATNKAGTAAVPLTPEGSQPIKDLLVGVS
jgi:hypothetical protein